MKLGSKVICIDDSLKEGLNMEEFHRDFHQWIKKGEEYTIRYFTTIGRFKESSFRIERFREIETAVIELQTEIEMAT